MIKLSSDLSLLRNKKAVKKLSSTLPGRSFASRLSSTFSSRTFACNLFCVALIVKLFFIPICYIKPEKVKPCGPRNRVRLEDYLQTIDLLSVLVCVAYFINIFAFPLLQAEERHKRFGNVKKVPQPFSVQVFLQAASTHSYLISLVTLYLLPPSNVPWITFFLKPIVMVIDTLHLYNYYTCDDYFKMEDYESAEKMRLHKCYEENHGTKKLTILESTNTCITMKNIGEEDLVVDFVIDRQTYGYMEYFEDKVPYESYENKYEFGYNYFREAEYEFTQQCRAVGCKVPPGKVFKLVTREYNAADLKEDELCFVIPEYRVFGTNIDNYVVTSIRFHRNKKRPFNVRLTQKYETRKQRKMREKYEKNSPAVVYRDIPKKSKKVKKITDNKMDEKAVTIKTKVDDNVE